MKRSEMLRIIWEAINELEDADHILTRIEEAGMLPPPSPLLVSRYLDGRYVGKSVLFHWEPEEMSEEE